MEGLERMQEEGIQKEVSCEIKRGRERERWVLGQWHSGLGRVEKSRETLPVFVDPRGILPFLSLSRLERSLLPTSSPALLPLLLSQHSPCP